MERADSLFGCSDLFFDCAISTLPSLQYLKDLSAYNSDLKGALMKVAADENGFAKLSDIKDIIVKFDAMKSEDDVHMYVVCPFLLSWLSLPLSLSFFIRSMK